jgi:photosystem II stability/assembly factor-like uncharacterized protein
VILAAGVEALVAAFCQAPSNPTVAYAVTLQDGVSRTDDFGASFGPPTPIPNPNLVDCAVDPTDPSVVYALAYTYYPNPLPVLFKSTDAGRSFFTIGNGLPEGLNSSFLAVAPTNPQTVYLASYDLQGLLWVSTDGGLNFHSLPIPPTSYRVHLHPTDDGTLFVVGDLLFLSTDYGASFTQVGAGLPLNPGNLVFDANDASVIYVVGNENGVFRSNDGGLTFERAPGLGDAQLLGLGAVSVGLSPHNVGEPPIVFVGTSLGPFKSTDGGDTFVDIRHGYRGTQVQDLAIDADGRLLIATYNTVGVFRSNEAGAYDIIGDTLPRGTATLLQAVAAAPDDPSVFIVAGADPDPTSSSDAIFWTADGGASWSRADTTPDFGITSRVRIAFAPTNPNRVYLVGAGLYRSDDRGQTFTRMSPDRQPLGTVAVDPMNADILYVGSWSLNQGLFKSTDGGSTLLPLGLSGNFIAIAIEPTQPQVIYAGRRDGAVIRSVDSGLTFTSASVGLGGDRVLGLAVDPSQPLRLFAWMHAGGLFRSEDGADSWTAVETDETLRRSAVQAGQPAMVVSPGKSTRVYVGNGSVLQFTNP